MNSALFLILCRVCGLMADRKTGSLARELSWDCATDGNKIKGSNEKKDVSSQFHLRTCADWSGGRFLERCPECTPNRRDSESRRTDQTHGKPVLESSS